MRIVGWPPTSDSAITSQQRRTTTMETTKITEGRNWGRTAMYVGLMFGLALAFQVVFAPAAHAQELDPSSWATSAIDFLKKLWVFVILAEIVAALTYTTAFFTQSWFPSFFQAFQGE